MHSTPPDNFSPTHRRAGRRFEGGNAACFVAAVATLVAGLAMPLLAAAQESFPSRPIRLIVGLAPGGFSDQSARLIAPELSKALGQSIIVENRTGANGNLAARYVADAAPDGYTLGLAFDGTFVAGAAFNPQTPFDPVKDFAAITKIADTPVMLTAHPGLQAGNIRELADLIKNNLALARPVTLDYGTAGNGSTGHLTGEYLKQRAGLSMAHVPYKGGGEALRDVMGGQIPLMLAAVAASSAQVKSGRLKALAITGDKRLSILPDVPTFAESNIESLKGFNVQSWTGLVAPAGTPRAIIERLHGEAVKILMRADVRERYAAFGAEVVANAPAEFNRQMAEDLERWKRLIADAKLRAE